jgi:acetyl esterase/lipase
VKRTSNVQYGAVGKKRLLLDVYEPADADARRPQHARRPAIIQIHGGGWVIGDKREQGLPLLNHLATNGWVGFNVNYRLSPRAVFPDHLIDIKRAIAWIREHADEYNIDPNFLVVTGGSAGGHLTALTGLTPNDPVYQPGFESADTSVQGAVPFYGVYCFRDRLDLCVPGFVGFIERTVMKVRVSQNPDAFRAASPLDRIGEHAPPFFVIHGDRDTLAPVGYAREFVKQLREVSPEPVAYAELHGAQHAFDIFYSPRASRAVEGVERFVTGLHERYLARHAAQSEAGASQSDAGTNSAA